MMSAVAGTIASTSALLASEMCSTEKGASCEKRSTATGRAHSVCSVSGVMKRIAFWVMTG